VDTFDIAWAQRYAVTTLCRILYTLDQGKVSSQKTALLWAKDALDPDWPGLIQQVVDDRSLGWDPYEPPRPGSVAPTIAFAEHAKARAASSTAAADDASPEADGPH
jgi:aminoglycoside adenylyltransferase-like protein